MKKIFLTISLASAFLIGAIPVFAQGTLSVTYSTVTFSGLQSASFGAYGQNVSRFDLFNDDTNTHIGERDYDAHIDGSADLVTQIGFSALSPGNYTLVVNNGQYFSEGGCTTVASCESHYNTNTDVDGTHASFTVAAAPAAAAGSMAISMPTSTAVMIWSYIGAQLGDSGLLAVLSVAGGIYLAFYVMEQLIALIPSKNKKE